LNFGLQAGHAEDRFYYDENGPLNLKYLDSVGSIENEQFIGLCDEWRKLDIRISLDKPASIWRFPIETISLSEGGFEKVYQSSVVFPNWKISLKDSWQVRIIKELKNDKKDN
jgi:alpha-amylase